MEKFYQHIETTSPLKGVVYVGANCGQEIPRIKQSVNNIILVEPIPPLHNFLSETYPEYLVLPYGLGSHEAVMPLYLASNNGESSSVLRPINHPVHYPGIKFEHYIVIQIKRFDNLIQEYNIDMSKFNVLVTDAQGYDLEAIKGFGEYIHGFDLIIAEYINSNLYENDASLKDIETYLDSVGFYLVETFDENIGAGNAAFRKKV